MNYLIALCFLILGIYILYYAYKKPSPMSNTNFKGYIGGIGFIYVGIMSLLGKMDLVQIIKDIFNIK
jgi:hypothetical protein